MEVQKMRNKINRILLTMLVVSFGACHKKDSSEATNTQTTRSYAGAGSDWKFTLNADGTFEATETESNTDLKGTYTTTSTGFQKLTVSTATGANAPAIGTIIGCSEIPGFAFVCKPVLASEDQLIGTIVTGTCPTTTWTNNFLNFQFNLDAVDMTKTTGAFKNSNENYDGDLFGTFKWDVANGSGTPLTHFVLAGYTELFPTSPSITGTCEKGILKTTSFNAYLAPAAGFVKVTEVDSPNVGNGIITMPIQTIGEIAAMNGEYAGFLYDATKASGSRVHPVKGSVSAGALSVESVDPNDLVTQDSLASGTATLSAVDSPSAGFIKGDISGNSLICMAGTNIQDSGKKALYCLGQNPGTPAKPYMLVLGSK